ncbi:unnamed protein product [Haemonchus placei]|uniref:MFS domain-containing protein n=1 Tax=Haemonchus placei TaxID=6290 RepID=A0A0N4WFP3_HAEPC|nr:unnamed protein product [Haemonchus placei]
MTTEKEYTTVPVEDGKEEAAVDQSPMKCVDDFLKMSNYCYLILLISEFFLLVGAGNMIFMVFAGEWRLITFMCVIFQEMASLPGSAPRVSCHGSNFTIKDVCKSHLDPNKLTDCDLEVNYEFKSLNVEFGYLCAEGRWVKSSISVQMVGVLIGTLFFGTMSDRYGRKSSLLISYVMTSVFSIAASFSNSLVAFTVLRSILGFFSGGLLGTYGVYKMEHIPKRHRFWVATVIAWAPNFIMLNVVAYFSHDWRTFQRVLVIISSPAILLFLFVHESPRWLIQKGKIKEARHVLQRIQHIDRQKESKKEEMEKMLDIAHQELQLREKKMKNYNVRHLFYNKEMTLATLVFCGGVQRISFVEEFLVETSTRLFCRFMSSMINYGLIFNIETLSGSFFVNSILMGFIRWSINIAFGIFITKTISAIEYYPTVVRNSGLAFKSTCSRLGTILAPQLFIVSSWDSLPYIVLTAMAALDTMFYQLVIPETKGKPLPENLPPKREKIRANLPSVYNVITN